MKQNANILAMIHRLPKLQEIQEMREKVNDTKLMSANPRVVIQHNISNYSKIFPLASLADLEQLEQSLDEINTQEIVSIIHAYDICFRNCLY